MCAVEVRLPGRARAITHHPRCKYRDSASANANVSSQTDRTTGLGDAHCPGSKPESRQEGAAEPGALQPRYFTWSLCGSERAAEGCGANSVSQQQNVGLKQPNPQEPFPSNRIILKLPVRTRRVSTTPAGWRLYIPVSGFYLRPFRAPGCCGSPLLGLLIRGCFFSAFCQHCWVETMAGTHNTHRSAAC